MQTTSPWPRGGGTKMKMILIRRAGRKVVAIIIRWSIGRSRDFARRVSRCLCASPSFSRPSLLGTLSHGLGLSKVSAPSDDWCLPHHAFTVWPFSPTTFSTRARALLETRFTYIHSEKDDIGKRPPSSEEKKRDREKGRRPKQTYTVLKGKETKMCVYVCDLIFWNTYWRMFWGELRKEQSLVIIVIRMVSWQETRVVIFWWTKLLRCFIFLFWRAEETKSHPVVSSFIGCNVDLKSETYFCVDWQLKDQEGFEIGYLWFGILNSWNSGDSLGILEYSWSFLRASGGS